MQDQPSEPMFNVPAVLVAMIGLMAVVHLLRLYLFNADQDVEFLLQFAFIPARYEPSLLLGDTYPGGLGAQIYTFVTYALIHADWMHLGFNIAWLLPFGSALARRFGPARFLLFMALTAAIGAAVHLAAHGGERVPVVGASAAISGAMAAAMRFAFQAGGPLGLWRHHEAAAYQVPAAPLAAALRDPRILGFLAVWFGVNLLFGLGSLPLTGEGQQVAWQAHIGGFLAGLLMFGLFDPIPPAGRRDGNAGWDGLR